MYFLSTYTDIISDVFHFPENHISLWYFPSDWRISFYSNCRESLLEKNSIFFALNTCLFYPPFLRESFLQMEFGAVAVLCLFSFSCCKVCAQSPDLFQLWGEANCCFPDLDVFFFFVYFHNFLPFLDFRSLTVMGLSIVFIFFVIQGASWFCQFVPFATFESFQAFFPRTELLFNAFGISPHSPMRLQWPVCSRFWYYPSDPQRSIFLNLFLSDL